jgi:hypothetical protein
VDFENHDGEDFQESYYDDNLRQVEADKDRWSWAYEGWGWDEEEDC